MTPRNEDFLFAQEAQAKGYVTEEQLEEGFLLQKRMAGELQIDERLAVILVKRGWMAEDQVRRVYARLEPEGKRVEIQGYRLVDRLGRGSMGMVYKAVHLGLNRVVAIKVLRRELLGENVHTERLKHEARLLADLEHPHIVRALDAGESNGIPYVVMEYVEGETLKDRIARKGAIDEDDALAYARGVADALEQARRMGIVHRDVKPGNILISTRGVAKLMDLGLAKGPVDMELTQHGATVGTPQFMAPEQVEEAGNVDARSDIYSLGATMYAMFTGRPPFTGSQMAEILNKVLNEQAIPIRARNPDVSPEVSYLVDRMMLKDPSLRYQTPADVVDHIDRITGGQSIIPQGFQGNWEGYLVRQRARRRTKWVALGAALILLTIGASWFLKVRGERDAARTRAAVLETRITNLADVVGAGGGPATPADVRINFARAADLAARLMEEQRAAGDEGSLPTGVRQALRVLKRHDERWQAYLKLAQQFEQDELNPRYPARQDYAEAYRLLGAFIAESGGGGLEDLRGVARIRRAGIRADSTVAWGAIYNEARKINMLSLEAYIEAYAEVAERLDATRFIGQRASGTPNTDLDQARAELHLVAGRLEAVLGQVASLEKDYADEVLLDRVQHWERLSHLVSEMEDAADAKLGPIQGAVLGGPTWPEIYDMRPVIRLVRSRFDDRKRALVRYARQLGGQVVVEARRQHEEGELRKARTRLTAMLDGLGPSVATEMRTQAEQLLKQVEADIAEIESSGTRFVRTTADSILRRLARRDVRGARRVLVTREAEAAQAKDHIRKQVAALGIAIDAVAGFLTQVPVDLSARVPLTHNRAVTVHPDGGTPVVLQRIKIVGVGAEALRVSASRKSGFGTRMIQVKDFALVSLLHPNLGGRVADRLPGHHGALVRLASLASEAGARWPRVADVRTQVNRLRKIERALAAQSELAVWSEFVQIVIQELEIEQEGRENRAYRQLQRVLKPWDARLFVIAYEEAEEFLNPAREWRFTATFDEKKAEMEEIRDKCAIEKEKREIERWLRGMHADPIPGRDDLTRIGCDFDNAACFENFRRGFARLIPDQRARPTTGIQPAVSDRNLLELLPHVRGVLPGRPLALENPFDTADPIEMQFTLNTDRGAFFLAFDIDGVKFGVLSADPKRNWHPDWTLPPHVLHEGESDRDFYGRGRGIGWKRDGSPHWGDITGRSWSWNGDRHRGRHHLRWEDLQEGQGDLFAFKPGTRYRVKVVRARDRISLYVATARRYEAARTQVDRERVFELVFSKRETQWGAVGTNSEVAPAMRRGTGLLQILSWSTVQIDDLVLIGRVRAGWKKKMRVQEAKRAAKNAEDAKNK